MRKRYLFIDTQFNQFQSTDFKEHHSNLNQSSENKHIFNEYLLEQYYQGAIGLMELIHRNHVRNLMYTFDVFKQISNTKIQYLQSQQSSCLWDKYLNNNQRPRANIKKSISTDKIKLLNQLTDKYIKKQRIKSEEKNRSYISNGEGKKIISKLNKLERMIKDIKRENKTSNQGSIIYSRAQPYQNIPVQFHPQYQYPTFTPPLQPPRYPPPATFQYIPTPQYHQYPYYPHTNPYPPYPIIGQDRMKTDEVKQIYEESMQSQEDIAKQLQDIKEQLKQLKLANTQYLQTNTIKEQRQFDRLKIQRVKTETQPLEKDKYLQTMIQRQNQGFRKKDYEGSLFPDEQFDKPSRLRTEKSQRPYQRYKQRDYEYPVDQIREEQFRRNIRYDYR